MKTQKLYLKGYKLNTVNDWSFFGITEYGKNILDIFDKPDKYLLKKILFELLEDSKSYNYTLSYMRTKSFDHYKEKYLFEKGIIKLEQINTQNGSAHNLCLKLSLKDSSYFIKFVGNEFIGKNTGDVNFNGYKELLSSSYLYQNLDKINNYLLNKGYSNYKVNIINPICGFVDKHKHSSFVIYPYIENIKYMDNDEIYIGILNGEKEKFKIVIKDLADYLNSEFLITDIGLHNTFFSKNGEKYIFNILDPTFSGKTKDLHTKLIQ